MFTEIRKDKSIHVWECGQLQIICGLKNKRIHIIFADKLNASIAESDFQFHAGNMADLKRAMKSLANMNFPLAEG